MISRADYLASKNISHADYYSQFVTTNIKRGVCNHIGLARIQASTDPHLNDIPLREWDQLHAFIVSAVGTSIGKANNGGISLSDTVCIAKQAAHTLLQDTFQ